MNLKHIRKRIDRIDRRVLKELNQRFMLARKTRNYKTRISDPERENQIFNKIKERVNTYPEIREEFALRLFDLIISESRLAQKNTNNRRIK